jgi:hypothetical protein
LTSPEWATEVSLNALTELTIRQSPEGAG